MDSAPAVGYHRIQAVLVKDVELDGQAKDRKNDAHEDQALEARLCQPRIGGMEDCCELSTVLPYADQDQYCVKSVWCAAYTIGRETYCCNRHPQD